MISSFSTRSTHRAVVLLLLACSLFSPPPSSSSSSRGLMGLPVVEAKTSSQYARDREREERRRRIEERQRRRRESKPHPGRRSSRNNSHTEEPKEERKEEGQFEELMQNFATKMAFLHQPKDIFEGTIKGLQSLLLGGAVGLVSFVGIPLISLYSQLRQDEGAPEEPSPVLGFVVGAVVGGLAGTASTVAGIGAALFQVGTGLWNTAGAVKAQASGMRWDARTRTWAFYSLPEEAEELDLTGGKNTSNNKRRSTSSVTDTAFYDLLDVPPEASRGEIKRAYYKKAKVLHPDKNPEDPEKAAEDFLKLHQAYQTLSDDQKRADYDKYGKLSNDGGDSEIPFDPSIFFAVMYDFQKVEPYIGELAIASFIDGILKLSQMENPSDAAATFLWEHFVGGDDGPRPRKRQVEIAQNLLSRIQTYVDGTHSPDEFRQDVRREAETIAAASSDGFTPQILDGLGAGLRLQAGRFRAFCLPLLMGWPQGTFYSLVHKKNRVAGKIRSVLKTVQLVRSTYPMIHYNQTEGNIGFQTKYDHPEEEEAAQKELYGLLPDVMDMAGSFILNDIAKAIQGACWRLFLDTSVDRKTRLLRAEALQILGQEFLRQGRSSQQRQNEEECLDKDAKAEGVKDKIMRAFEISQMKGE